VLMRLLRLGFNFDRWHVHAADKPNYVRLVTKLGNSVEGTKVLEIGCGLGNLVSTLNFQTRIGIDLSEDVVRAAKFINKFQMRKVNYIVGSFGEASLLDDIDLLILINWIHRLNPSKLENEIRKLMKSPLNNKAYMISEGVSHYEYYHDRVFFEKFGDVVREELIDDRQIFLIKLKQSSF
jgi:SAM-dependent methyltransferase